jgi:hypothetical protein
MSGAAIISLIIFCTLFLIVNGCVLGYKYLKDLIDDRF